MTRILCAKHIGRASERGFSMLEAMVASFIMLVGIGGLMALFVVAAAKNAGQGDQATRTTEYAQDKMEQLLALGYLDTSSKIVGAATLPAGGWGLKDGGTLFPAAATTDYVDYVDSTGAISSTAAGALYMREWQIATDASLVNGLPRNVKTITVVVKAQFSADIGANLASLAPSTTLIAVKESY